MKARARNQEEAQQEEKQNGESVGLAKLTLWGIGEVSTASDRPFDVQGLMTETNREAPQCHGAAPHSGRPDAARETNSVSLAKLTLLDETPQTNLNPEAAIFYTRRRVEEGQDEEDDTYLDFYDLKPLHMEDAADEVGPGGENESAVTETDDESLKFDATGDEMQDGGSDEDDEEPKDDEPEMQPSEIAAIRPSRKAAETKYGRTEADAEGGPAREEEEGEDYARIWNVDLTSMEQNGGFLIGKDAGVISFEEHKLRKGMIGWIREEFRKTGLTRCMGSYTLIKSRW